MEPYKVQFEIFEGPLDLLLYLVKKEEVDSYEVNLTKIATQFIEYIDVMRELDLEVAGEFLVMSATLMLIKSRELLPVDQQVAPEGEEEGEDPRWELIRQLVEYRKFKDTAARLQAVEATQELVYPRVAPTPEMEAPAPGKPEVSIFDLIKAVSAVLKRFQARDTRRDIFDDPWTVSEKIEVLRTRVSQQRRLKFFELFAETTTRTEVVVTLLALLELIRLKQVQVRQDEPFSDIEIEACVEADQEAGAESPAGDAVRHDQAGSDGGGPALAAAEASAN